MKALILLSMLMPMSSVARAQSPDAAIQLYEHGKFQDAAKILSELSRTAPHNPDLHAWLGKTYLKLHRWDDAIQEFGKAIEVDPKNGTYHLWLGRAYGNKADHASGLSRVLVIGNFRILSLARKVGKEFETAVRLSPDNVDVRFDLLEFYAEAPGIAGGGKDKAEAQAREIARLSPRLGYAARAEIYTRDKEWNQARAELIQATEKYPDNADGYVDLAEFLMRRRDYSEAAKSAQKAVALNGSMREARMWLAAAQVELNQNTDDALKALQELATGPLTDTDPSFEEVYYWLGRAYLALGQKAEARLAFETSLSFDQDYSRSREALLQVRQLSWI
jgi:predicted Zn-dependent protease